MMVGASPNGFGANKIISPAYYLGVCVIKPWVTAIESCQLVPTAEDVGDVLRLRQLSPVKIS